MSLVDLLFPSFVFNSFQLNLSSTIIGEKINLKKTQHILIIILLIIAISFSTFVFDNVVRGVFNFFCLLVCYYFIYNKTINKAFILAFAVVFLFFISEMLFSLLLYIASQIWNLNIDIQTNLSLLITSNICIGLLTNIIYRIKTIKQILNNLIENCEGTKYTKIILIILMIIFILVNKNFILFGFKLEYILNLFLVVLFCVIAYLLIKEKNLNISMYKKYEYLFNYLEIYEKEINKNRMIIHDFNNQLISIKGFNNKKNKDLDQYLDTIIKDNKKDESKIINDIEKLPKGGLKGLIYYKLGYLKDEGLEVITNISSTVKKNSLANLDANLYKDIIKILGVFLDNAIEAAIESKEKQIVLEIFCTKKEFNFILSNTFSGKIDIKKISDIKYTTKGKNRGYGLALVKKIVSNNSKLTVEKEIINNYYVTKLKINLK